MALIRSFFQRKKNLIFLNYHRHITRDHARPNENFTQQIGESFYQGALLKSGKNWNETFRKLNDAIIRFKPHLHQRKGIYYRVIDEYTLFYFNWIEPIKETLLVRGMKKNYWNSMQNSPEWYNWVGYSFEALCYKHISQISEALNLSPTAIPNTWRYTPIKETKEDGAQIDLLFDRKDNAIILYTDWNDKYAEYAQVAYCVSLNSKYSTDCVDSSINL